MEEARWKNCKVGCLESEREGRRIRRGETLETLRNVTLFRFPESNKCKI